MKTATFFMNIPQEAPHGRKFYPRAAVCAKQRDDLAGDVLLECHHRVRTPTRVYSSLVWEGASRCLHIAASRLALDSNDTNERASPLALVWDGKILSLTFPYQVTFPYPSDCRGGPELAVREYRPQGT